MSEGAYACKEMKYLIAVMRLTMDRFARSIHYGGDASCWQAFCECGEVSEIRTALAKYNIKPVLKPN